MQRLRPRPIPLPAPLVATRALAAPHPAAALRSSKPTAVVVAQSASLVPAVLAAERVAASLRLAPQSLPQVPVVQRSSLVQPVVPPSLVLTPPTSAVVLVEAVEQPLVQRA